MIEKSRRKTRLGWLALWRAPSIQSFVCAKCRRQVHSKNMAELIDADPKQYFCIGCYDTLSIPPN